MYLEIVTPEEVLLSGEVNSVSVPGVMGSFQMLDGHAPIVSLLEEGEVKVDSGSQPEHISESKFSRDKENNLKIHIKGGVVEMNDNKAIVLVD